jgi:hypothetical protein
MSCTNIRCYTEHSRCYTLDLREVDRGQPHTWEMITISDSVVKDDPAFAAAAGLESCAHPEPGLPWDQIGAEA